MILALSSFICSGSFFSMERRFIFLVYTVEIVVVVRERTCVSHCHFLQGSSDLLYSARLRVGVCSSSLETLKGAS